MLKATGKEKVEFRESHNETDGDGNSITKYVNHEDEKEFFKQKVNDFEVYLHRKFYICITRKFSHSCILYICYKPHMQIVICAIPQEYMPGNYMYPFEYQLPVELPGVFHLESYSSGHVDSLNAKIKYKFKATLDVGGFFASDLKADCNVVVHERNLQLIRPSEDSTTQNVNFLCCFNKGSCQLAVAMDKNVYLPGEVAQIQCQINNGSSVDITAMRCHLYQDIKLQLKHGGSHVFTREMATRAFPGVKAQSSSSQPQPLPLASDHGIFLNPSTTGKLIQCSYRINVECDIPWCPDVVLHLPVTLIAPEIPNVSWVPASTDGYIAQ